MSMIPYLDLLLLPVSEVTWQEQVTTLMHQRFARMQDLEIQDLKYSLYYSCYEVS